MESKHRLCEVRTLHGHDRPVSAVRFFTPIGTLLVSTGRDASIRIWDVLTGYCVKHIDTGGEWIRDIEPSFDGVYIVAGGNDRTTKVWEASSGQPKTSLPGPEGYIECCVFAPALSHSNIAALAPSMVSSTFIGTGSRDKTIKLWNDRGILIKTLVGHDSWVRGLAFHPGGRYLISVGDDRTIRCWDLSQGACLVTTIDDSSEQFITCIRWGPKQIHRDRGICHVLGTGGANSCVRIWM